MLLSHVKRLCIFSLSIALYPNTTFASNRLPASLQERVPQCAHNCLQASLDERFPVACSGNENIQCLCSRYSNKGESLGEVALSCMYISCSTPDQGAASAYNVCLGLKDAVMPTQTALTVVASSTPRPNFSSSTRTRGAETRSSAPLSTPQTQARPTQSVFIDSISAVPSATSATSNTRLPAMETQETPKMTAAQIAGLSVAIAAAFILAIGLMALSVCLRKRKENKLDPEADEKFESKREKILSERFSHYVPVDSNQGPPMAFPLPPHPPFRQPGQGQSQGGGWSAGTTTSRMSSTAAQGSNETISRTVNTSSPPLDQIGLAISAELDNRSASSKVQTRPALRVQRPGITQNYANQSVRPVSTLTQDTIFEEDDIPAKRRSSMLLPTPPVPIAPIRGLQPSKQRPAMNVHSQNIRRSELFLNIPPRHERPKPKRIIVAEFNGSPKRVAPSSTARLAPPIELTSTSSSSSNGSTGKASREGSNTGDILDYYLSAHQGPNSTSRASPAIIVRPRESPRAIQIRSNKSLSTVSRTTSRASTNIRDSFSSQTSFETADPYDPTPEEEREDKRLSDDDKHHLSPVAESESPISKLKYPKIPRASNQLVPRRSPSSTNGVSAMNTPKSHRQLPEQGYTPQKRHHDLPPLLLESRRRLNSPHKEPINPPPRKGRSHVRSNSTESWTSTPASKVDRASRVQSGAWGKSPMMYEEDFVRPLNVRRKRDGLSMQEINVGRDVDIDSSGLHSPVWVPRLTPTRKGDDLFISVGWNGDHR